MAQPKEQPGAQFAAAHALFGGSDADVDLLGDGDSDGGQADVGTDVRLRLVNPSPQEFSRLLDALRCRLQEGHGETLYEIGIGDAARGLSDAEMEASKETLQRLADAADADASLLRERREDGGAVAEFLVRRRAAEGDFLEIRVAVVGNVDAGKSTLLGVLTHNTLDNGRGLSRARLFRHKHESESGRTSSVGHDILGFDSKGRPVNAPDAHTGALDWTEICMAASKVITFIDLAGHEKYLKTTVFGLTGHVPDFAMLMVGANHGVIGMTKEHLGLALALNVPVFVVVTKIDMCPPNVFRETMSMLTKVLKSPGCRKIPLVVSSPDDAVVTATNFVSERICPIFQVSNVTGENLDLLRLFLNLLTTRAESHANEPAYFQIDETFAVPGVGTVVSGTMLRGTVQPNDTLLLGPDALGQFQPVSIKSIHRKRTPVNLVRGGQAASFALKKVKRGAVRKGMVLAAREAHPVACREFEADILVLHHPTTIGARYQAMVHCGPVRQTASLQLTDREHMRTGDKATVRFRLVRHPECIPVGARIVFREGRTKAVGTVTRVFEAGATAAPQAPRAENTRQQAKNRTISV